MMPYFKVAKGKVKGVVGTLLPRRRSDIFDKYQ